MLWAQQTILEKICWIQRLDGLDNIEIEEVTLADLELYDEQGNPLPQDDPSTAKAQGPILDVQAQRQQQEADRIQREERRKRSQAMAQKSKCPVFSEEENYHSFNLKCQAFLELTDIDEEKRGLYLGLNALPPGIQQRFLDENPTTTLKGPNSEKVFWDFLGGIYEKDPMMEM